MLPLREHSRDSRPAKTRDEDRLAWQEDGYVCKNNKLRLV